MWSELAFICLGIVAVSLFFRSRPARQTLWLLVAAFAAASVAILSANFVDLSQCGDSPFEVDVCPEWIRSSFRYQAALFTHGTGVTVMFLAGFSCPFVVLATVVLELEIRFGKKPR